MNHQFIFSLAGILTVLGSGASAHALDLQQKANPQNRAFENLPQLNLIRGAQLKDIPLEITAEGDWTLSASETWAQLEATSGNGNQTVVLSID